MFRCSLTVKTQTAIDQFIYAMGGTHMPITFTLEDTGKCGEKVLMKSSRLLNINTHSI